MEKWLKARKETEMAVHFSEWKQVTSGAPQGPMLGSVFFHTFTQVGLMR